MPSPRSLLTLLASTAALLAAPLATQAGASPADPIAHATGDAHVARDFNPNDPGKAGPGDWQQLQWNFLPTTGVNAPGAWDNLIRAARPGGKGVIVAVLDTGIAYENRGRYRRSPDFAASRFVPGYDFIDHDPFPDDQEGHGTFVAGLIGENTDNGRALTGLAYGTTLMPVRVLDRDGLGHASAIAAGVRFAADRGAQVINLSLVFSTGTPVKRLAKLRQAIAYATSRGALVVASSGNDGVNPLAYPARFPHVLAVGATTEHGCLAEYSNTGNGLGLVAPGGGDDSSDQAAATPGCDTTTSGRDIYQLTFTHNPRRFGYDTEEGTSMSAPHAVAAAALVIASGVIGTHPSPAAVASRLESTARDLGAPGYDTEYGAGLLDAAAATAPAP